MVQSRAALTFNQVVVGSIPTGLTIFIKGLQVTAHLRPEMGMTICCQLGGEKD
jgi:hypothetical protein